MWIDVTAARARVLGLAACVTALACDEPSTGIILEVSSDIRVPQDMDGLVIRAYRRPDQPLMVKTYELGESKTRLPARLGLVSDGDVGEPITIDLTGRLGTKLMVSRTVRVPFVRGTVRDVPVSLSRECTNVLCPSGRTCVPGKGCVSPDLDRIDDDRGPPCHCESLLPLCIGATWTYAETAENGLLSVKSALIQDRSPIGSTPGKEDVTAFVQFRTYAFGMSRRWTSAQGTPGAARIAWEKDEFFDDRGRLLQTTVYLPRKLRVDETRTTIGERWTERVETVVIRPGVPPGPPSVTEEHWEVVDPAEQPNYPRLLFPNGVCHRRTAIEGTVTGAPQTYCFAKKIGKVYERTVGGDEEILTAFEVPGCGRLAP